MLDHKVQISIGLISQLLFFAQADLRKIEIDEKCFGFGGKPEKFLSLVIKVDVHLFNLLVFVDFHLAPVQEMCLEH